VQCKQIRDRCDRAIWERDTREIWETDIRETDETDMRDRYEGQTLETDNFERQIYETEFNYVRRM